MSDIDYCLGICLVSSEEQSNTWEKDSHRRQEDAEQRSRIQKEQGTKSRTDKGNKNFFLRNNEGRRDG